MIILVQDPWLPVPNLETSSMRKDSDDTCDQTNISCDTTSNFQIWDTDIQPQQGF